MRQSRITLNSGRGLFHAFSRLANHVFLFESDAEKERLRNILRKCEDFSGVHVITYAVMSNHFHFLVEVPLNPAPVDEAELMRRIKVLYGAERSKEIFGNWDKLRKANKHALVEEDQQRYRMRMGNISQFMKTFKMRHSTSYKRDHEHTGTLWEGRFRSVLVEDSDEARSAVAAYIDLNPVRAGMVDDPKDYRWSGYGEASGGNNLAKRRLARVYGIHEPDWKEISKRYRVLLYRKGVEKTDANTGEMKRPGFTQEEVSATLKSGGKITLPDVLRCHVRYFISGVAIGSKAFVNKVFEDNRSKFGAKRKTGARPMRFAQWNGLCSARDLKLNTISPIL